MDIKTYMQGVGRQARAASRAIAAATTGAKNTALLAMAAEIRARRAELLAANQRDLDRTADQLLQKAKIDAAELALRTARADRKGTALTLIGPKDMLGLKRIEKLIGKTICK